MTTFENLTKSQKLRASLHRDVQSICRQTCHYLGFEMTKPSMEIIAELLYKKLSIYGLDLKAFAKHAKRSTINADDVKLLVRRNPSLKAHLTALANNLISSSKDRRRKTNSSLPNVKEIATATKSKSVIESDKEEEEKEKKDKQKEVEKDLKMDNQIENMSIDCTSIDLTFD